MENIKLHYKWDQIAGIDLWGIAFPKGMDRIKTRFIMFYVGHGVKNLNKKRVLPTGLFKGKIELEIDPTKEAIIAANMIADKINNLNDQA